MAYYIAIGSSDGVNTDLKFGEVEKFLIYKVEGEKYELHEERVVAEGEACVSKCGDKNGCSGGGHGCGGGEEVAAKVTAVEDCRAVVCKKIGFQAQKQFEKRAISVFDIETKVTDALNKIASYYNKIDNNRSLRAGT
ncbi:MAG: hypothetical protein J6U54_25315 [Clostridiales bacterium]|nr:hypothetical protein [Clostridiales bacterium]